MGYPTVKVSNFELSDTGLAGGAFARELRVQRNTRGCCSDYSELSDIRSRRVIGNSELSNRAGRGFGRNFLWRSGVVQ